MKLSVLESKILNYLKKSNKKIKTSDIALNTNMDRHTASKYLELLKNKGLVGVKFKGKSKFWSYVKSDVVFNSMGKDVLSSQLLEALKNFDYEIKIQNKKHDLLWNNKDYLDKKCYGSQKCSVCPAEESFKTGLPVTVTLKNGNITTKKMVHPLRDESGKVVAVIEITEK